MSSIKVLFWSLFLMISVSACKSEFERVRTSGDPELMYKKAQEYFEDEDYSQSQMLYEAIIPFYRGKKEAADMFYNYAYTHYNLGDYLLANHYFKNFSNTYTNHDKREDAQFMSAYSFYKLSPNAKLDQSYSDMAIAEFQLFINTFPTSSKVVQASDLIEEMRKKREEKAYQEGQLYFNIKQYQSAIASFENMLTDYPESKRAMEVKYKVILSAYKLAKNSIYNKKQERFEDVIKRVDDFLLKNEKSKYRRELKKLKENSKEQITLL